MLTQDYLSFLVIVLDIINLQCCNYCHLSSDFSSKFQSYMTIFHHKLLTRGGRVLANGWTHPSYIKIFARLFIKKCHPKSYHMTLHIIFSIVCYDEVGLCAQNTYTILASIANIMREGLCNHFKPKNKPISLTSYNFCILTPISKFVEKST